MSFRSLLNTHSPPILFFYLEFIFEVCKPFELQTSTWGIWLSEWTLTYRGLIKLRSHLFGKSIGENVLFDQGQVMSGFCCFIDVQYLELLIEVIKFAVLILLLGIFQFCHFIKSHFISSNVWWLSKTGLQENRINVQVCPFIYLVIKLISWILMTVKNEQFSKILMNHDFF